jgi:hypothetical protein
MPEIDAINPNMPGNILRRQKDLIRILCLLSKGYCALEKHTGAKRKNAQGLYGK